MSYLGDEIRPDGQSHLSMDDIKLIIKITSTITVISVDFVLLFIVFVYYLVKERVMLDPFKKYETAFSKLLF